MTENYIECLIVRRLKDAVLQVPVTEERDGELIDIISEMPPDSIFTDNPCLHVCNQFIVNKRINVYVAYRLYAKARGDSPQEEPEDIKLLVRTLTAYYSAYYDLLFECWDYLKPLAISEGILTEESHPRDAFKIILDGVFIKNFISLSNDNRSLDKQARSIHDRITRDMKDNKNTLENTKLTRREISMLYADWDTEFQTLHPLSQLLFTLADKHKKKSSVIATAQKHFLQTTIDRQREQKTYHRRLFN
jgi:hypothetical protein